jgi:hypothetical protein
MPCAAVSPAVHQISSRWRCNYYFTQSPGAAEKRFDHKEHEGHEGKIRALRAQTFFVLFVLFVVQYLCGSMALRETLQHNFAGFGAPVDAEIPRGDSRCVFLA